MKTTYCSASLRLRQTPTWLGCGILCVTEGNNRAGQHQISKPYTFYTFYTFHYFCINITKDIFLSFFIGFEFQLIFCACGALNTIFGVIKFT